MKSDSAATEITIRKINNIAVKTNGKSLANVCHDLAPLVTSINFKI